MAVGDLFFQSFPIELKDGLTDGIIVPSGLTDIFPPDDFEIIGRHIINSTGAGGRNRATVVIIARELPDVPSVPLSLSANPGASGEVVLTWTVPTSDGGAPITDYLIEFSLNGQGIFSAFVHTPTAVTGITVNGLVSSELYDFRVSAINAQGTGPATSISTSIAG